MIFRGLTTDGDWKFGKGKQDYTRDLEALKLNILTRLKSWKGDCFFSLLDGVDYNNFLDVGTKQFLDRDIRRVVIQTPGVIRIIPGTYESQINSNREFSAIMNINTIFGILEVVI